MASSISDPILGAESRRSINDELLSCFVVCESSFHLYHIVAIAKFSDTEAAHLRKIVNLREQVFVSISMESIDRAAKEVVLNSEFSGRAGVNLGDHLVGGKDISGISAKIHY